MLPLKTRNIVRNKPNDLARLILDSQLSRRELLKQLAVQGLSFASLAPLVSRASTERSAEQFDWKRHEGKWVHVLLVEHPYATAIIDNVDDFKYLTGMNVRFELLGGQEYFDRMHNALMHNATDIDVLMTGAYATWIYGPKKKFVDCNPLIRNPEKTSPDYDWDDFIPNVRNSCAWNGIAGAQLGTSDAHQWCIPLGYEQNCISYNKDILKELDVPVPQNLDELIHAAERINQSDNNTAGIGLRGSSDWSTIHAGFLSAYSNYGETDLRMKSDGKLRAAVNTEGSRHFHEKWIELVKSGASSQWAEHTWYEVSNSLKNKKCAMIYDADILGYEANSPLFPTAGEIGYTPFKANPNAASPTSNIWITGLAIPQHSANIDGGWYFTQWATGKSHGLFSAISRDAANPVRSSVWKNSRFKSRLSSRYQGYLESHEAQVDGSSIKFTANPLFYELNNEWAQSLQDMVLKKLPVDEALDKLEKTINQKLDTL